MKKQLKVQVAAAAALAALVTSQPALAQAANQTQLDTMANAILNLLTGSLAKIGATIALVFAGWLFLSGTGNKALIVSIIIGCFIIFGAGWLVSLIAGG
ncbi:MULTISPECIES: TrbC/VirB2 family protein [unclassified Novosphingobium]|uniref:TrbC/VirB2 family protein n=1 Tax=unclassified Novosphingobium TaxID=2644732 RepID=UPI00146D6EA4|nr:MULTISPECIES: TrbC/VirB2 family protein [unclassified Novosphingobium]NMN07551.1 type IV secretion system protein VirB2 [Novosphingobium sp. SG919]NMN89846.1 type IV secretion system protein VirB2 [Novosphingobium sp. SG916]